MMPLPVIYISFGRSLPYTGISYIQAFLALAKDIKNKMDRKSVSDDNYTTIRKYVQLIL